MNIRINYLSSRLLRALAFLIFLSGCAGSPGSIQTLQPLVPGIDLREFQRLSIVVLATPDVSVDEVAFARLHDLIVHEIQKHSDNHFVHILDKPGDSPSLEGELVLTQYDEGNAGMRFVLAGLGAMSVEGDLTIRDGITHQVYRQQRVSKVFAWGGIYGAITTIQDVEVGFAKAVAEALMSPE